MVDSNQLTTISDLQAHMIYTIRVQAFTTRGAGPLSAPVLVKTQQGVPSQPSNLRASAISSTAVQLNWQKPSHVGEAIIGYEIYWNDTFSNREDKRAIPDVESYTLGELSPDTLYYVWVAAKSRRGEGAATPPIPVKTEQFGKCRPTSIRLCIDARRTIGGHAMQFMLTFVCLEHSNDSSDSSRSPSTTSAWHSRRLELRARPMATPTPYPP